MSQVQNGTKEMLPDKRTYTVEEVAHILGIGRTSAYILVKEGHFKIVRISGQWHLIHERTPRHPLSKLLFYLMLRCRERNCLQLIFEHIGVSLNRRTQIAEPVHGIVISCTKRILSNFNCTAERGFILKYMIFQCPYSGVSLSDDIIMPQSINASRDIKEPAT